MNLLPISKQGRKDAKSKKSSMNMTLLESLLARSQLC